MIFLDLARNIAILLALCMGYTMVFRMWDRRSLSGRILAGVIFGAAAVVGMLTPMVLAPGIIFDGRSILISIAGLFAGGLSALIAAAIAVVCRAAIGGGGVYMGCGVIVTSAVLGAGYHRLRRRNTTDIKTTSLLLFGLVVHIAMLLWTVALPADIRWHVLGTIALPVLLVYPIGTVLVGRLLANQDAWSGAQASLRESEERYRAVAEDTPVLICSFLPSGKITYVNEAYCKYFEKMSEELVGSSFLSLIPEEDREAVMANISALTVESPNQSHEHRVIAPDGAIRWQRWTNRAMFGAKGQPVAYHSIGEDVTERKQAVQAVRKSEEQLRELTDMLPQSLCEVAETGLITYANRTAFESFGYTEADLAGGLKIFEMIAPHDRDKAANIVRSLMQGGMEGTVGNEYTALRKDGSTFPVLIYSIPILKGGKPGGLRALLLDITERKRAEEERERAREFLQMVIDGFPDALMVINRDYTIALANRTVREMAESKDPVAACLKCHQVSHDCETPCDSGEHRCPMKAVIETKAPVRIEHIHHVAQGRGVSVEFIAVPILDEDGEVVQIIEAARDITKRKKAEERAARFNRVLEGSLNEIYIFDAETLHFVEVNRGARENLGYTIEELRGFTPLDLKPEFTAESFAELVDPLRAGTKEKTQFTTVHRRKDGSLYPVEVHLQLMADATPVFVAIILDITTRKRAEAEREKAEDQLRQAQKMEAVGQLAGGVAHDFNNLLQAILGYGDLALDDIGADNPARVLLEEMLKTGDRAKTLVRQLLAFSRRQVLDMKNIDLNEVVAELMKLIQRVIGEHITLDVLAGHDLGTVRADPGQIEQILMNLCVNARDAMPEGGTITVETENVRIDEAFCETHTWAKPGRYAFLSVTDTGCGMDEETLGKVFEPFFTTKDMGKGTGLGLSTVYGLVKQHQGMVHVYSEVGKGTTFKIYLPLVERSAATVGDKVKGPVPGGTETILLAEDDASIRELSQTFLERAGYTVLTACDGEEALRVFDERADAIDLALLDVMMPKLGGRAVYERIREKRPRVRVLFSSGYSMNAIHTGFVLDEGLALIQKPCQRDDLLRKVREVLDEG